MTPRLSSSLLLIITLLWAAPVFGGGDNFQPGTCGKSKLEMMDGVPVLFLEGSPAEIGKAQAELLRKEVNTMFRFYLEPASLLNQGMEKMTAEAMKMDPYLPDRFKAELKAMAKASDHEYDRLLTGNAFPDVYRGGGCSTLAVGPDATKEGVSYLARNLDFFPNGVLNRIGLVTVYRLPDQYNFVSVTWPALSGVLSGMNEKGLCCAVMEVRSGTRKYAGMPSIFLFRRVMEEAATVEEGLAILKKEVKVVSNNLTLIDASGASAVAEIGPGHFEVRKPSHGYVFSTNHHREKVRSPGGCRRYKTLTRMCEEKKGVMDVAFLKDVLHKVNQGLITVQSMIFAPESLELHLSMGALPSSGGEYKTLSFKEVLTGKTDSKPGPASGEQTRDR